MPSASQKNEKARAAYKRWYKKNKTNLARKRAEKYAKDPDLRKKATEYALDYRTRNPRKPATGVRYYEYQGAKMEVFKIGVVAEMLERSIQTLRLWEKAGHIPPPSYESAHRAYTMTQIKLIGEFADLMTEVRHDPKRRDEALAEKTEYIKTMWKRANLP